MKNQIRFSTKHPNRISGLPIFLYNGSQGTFPWRL